MSFSGSKFTSNNESTDKIFKNHLLLLANSDIVVSLYQNEQKSWSDSKENFDKEELASKETIDETNDLSYAKTIGNLEEDENVESCKDPYSNFFNCLVENDSFLDMDELNRVINNNELKYIFYSNKINFFNLMKFFCFKIVRLTTNLTTLKGQSVENFESNCKTLLKSVRFLTKIMPVFFELCYQTNETDINEDIIFWNANTSETFQDMNSFRQKSTLEISNSALSFGNEASKTAETLSSLNVEINFKSRNNSSNFLNQPNLFLDSVAKRNNLPLGISLLSSLLKLLFMEGLTLPLSHEDNKGHILFQLWNSGILSQDFQQNKQIFKPNPALDSNRLEIMNLVEVLCSNTLYSSFKIDNKFLGGWCCSMPEYLSVYLINSLINNFVDENKVFSLAQADLKMGLFAYPQEYNIFKVEKAIIKFSESETIGAKSTGGNSSSFHSGFRVIETPLSVQESCALRERFLKTSRNILSLYFSFDPSSLSNNTKLQIFNSGSDISDITNVCKRSFKNLNTLSDFKIILISIVKVLKLPIHKAVEDENKFFNLAAKNSGGFFTYFTRSNNTQDQKNKDAPSVDVDSSEESTSSLEENTADSDDESLPKNLISLLTIFYEMLNSNDFFETHVLEIYSNKLFVILLYYLKKQYLNKNFASTTLPILTKLMIKITSTPIFSLRSLKYINYDYYTEKLPRNLKIIDNSVNIENETHRDFFIYHISNMITNDIDNNLHPKAYLYEILNNLLLATPKYLASLETNNVKSLLAKEQAIPNNKMGSFHLGVNYPTCKKLLEIFYALAKNKEYFHSCSVDKNDNYRSMLEKAVETNAGGHANKTDSEDRILAGYNVHYKTACGTSESDTKNILMWTENSEEKVNLNDISKVPYCFTPANKLATFSFLLRSVAFIVINCFADYKCLIYLLCKYPAIFNELNQMISSLDSDIAAELAPLLLRFLPTGMTKVSNVSTGSLNLPFDIALHSYHTFIDEILATDDDAMNDFDSLRFNTFKKASNTSMTSEYCEDEYYYKNNSTINFIDPSNSSMLDLTTGRRIFSLNTNGPPTALEKNHPYSRPQLSLNVSVSNNINHYKQKNILEKSSDLFLPTLYNNSVYNSIICKRPLGLSNKKIKKMVVRNSDNFRQSLTTDSLHHKSFWFIGNSYFVFLLRLISLISKHYNNKLSTLKENDMNTIMAKIGNLEDEIISKKLSDSVPNELNITFHLHQYSTIDETFNSTTYQLYQTLIWRDIFNNHSVEYKQNSEEISGNSDLLNNLSNSHNVCLPAEDIDTQQTPSSPMLEKWVSNNSLLKVESSQSNFSYSTNINTSFDRPIEVIHSLSSNTDDHYSSFYTNFLNQDDSNKFIVTNGLSQPLLWYSTNVKLFPVKKLQREEFSLLDMTSHFLNKFKFNKSSIPPKTPEEFAAEEIKKTYTPRSSISSIPSRK